MAPAWCDLMHRIEGWVLLVAVACGVASLTHFFHNAEFCGDYPNLPAWITRESVWLAWAGITLLGGSGLGLFRAGHRKSSLGVLAAYGALGCDGLGHYGLAPMARHTAMMNFSIWFEVVTGLTLLAVALGALVIEVRQHPGLIPAPLSAKSGRPQHDPFLRPQGGDG